MSKFNIESALCLYFSLSCCKDGIAIYQEGKQWSGRYGKGGGCGPM